MEDIYSLIKVAIFCLVMIIYARIAERHRIFFVFAVILSLIGIIYGFGEAMNYFGVSETIISFLIYFLIIAYPCLFLLINHFVKYLVKDKVRIDTKDSIDLNKDKEYYRGLLKKLNMAEICYLEDMKCDGKKYAAAVLLHLEMKGFIKITNLYIEINEEKIAEKKDLSKTEQYILNHVTDGILTIKPKNLKRVIEYDLFEKGMIKDNDVILRKIVLIELISLLILIGNILFFNIDIQNILMLENRYVLFGPDIFNGLLKGLIIFSIISFMVMYPKALITTYIRTDIGKEIARKGKALKNYIKDFSKLDSRNKKELIMWEDYLIYSVGFGINKKILKEIKEFINISHLKEDITLEYDD